MLKRISLMLVACCFFITMMAQSNNQIELFLDYEATNALNELTNEKVDALETLLKNINKDEIVQLEIISHAPNRNLGEQRLALILDFFKKEGLTTEKMDIATQLNDEHKVQLTLVTSISTANNMVDNSSTLVPKVYCTGTSKKAQVFSIEPDADVNIKGAEGTELKINRDDLVYENGQAVKEPIKVELKEFYTSRDILLAELHTMEGEQILETGGMLNLKITAQGKPLNLRSKKSAKIRMPAKTAKTKAGMNLYFGKRMDNGTVDWRLQEREEALSVPPQSTVVANTFAPNSYIQLRKDVIIDSITYNKKIHVKAKNVLSNNYPNFSKHRIVHTHEEEYFDLEIPYFNPNIVDGVWVNVDKPFGGDLFAPKPVDILVELKGVPNKGINLDGEPMAYTPKVALMLKERAVFLRSNLVATYSRIEQQNLKFNDVPVNQEVVLVAFLDTGKELLFASHDVKTIKNMPEQVLEMKPISKTVFDGAMTNLAN